MWLPLLVLGLSTLVALLFKSRRKTPSPPNSGSETETKDDLERKRKKEKLNSVLRKIGAIAGTLVIAHLLLRFTFTQWYQGQFISPMFWVIQIALLAAILWLASAIDWGKNYIARPLFGLIALCLIVSAFKGFTLSNPFSKNSVPVRGMPIALEPTGSIGGSRFKLSPWITCVDNDQPEVLDSIRVAFPTDTVMWNIAAAETDCIHEDSIGRAIQNKDGAEAYGVYQIHVPDHGKYCGNAELPEFDIYTLEGNIACAKKLRERNGYQDWEASRSDWGPWVPGGVVTTATAVATTTPTSSDLYSSSNPRFVSADTFVVLPNGELSEEIHFKGYTFTVSPTVSGQCVEALLEDIRGTPATARVCNGIRTEVSRQIHVAKMRLKSVSSDTVLVAVHLLRRPAEVSFR